MGLQKLALELEQNLKILDQTDAQKQRKKIN